MQWANRNKYPKDKDDNQSDPSEITRVDLIFFLWAERKRGKNQLVRECNRIWFYSIDYTVYFYPTKSLIYIDISES